MKFIELYDDYRNTNEPILVNLENVLAIDLQASVHKTAIKKGFYPICIKINYMYGDYNVLFYRSEHIYRKAIMYIKKSIYPIEIIKNKNIDKYDD